MCSLFKKNQRGWFRNSLSKENSNRNLTYDSLFDNDLSIDEMRKESDGEVGSGIRKQHLIKQKIQLSEKKNRNKPKGNKTKGENKTKRKSKNQKKKPIQNRGKKNCTTCIKSNGKVKKRCDCSKSKKFSKKLARDIFYKFL